MTKWVRQQPAVALLTLVTVLWATELWVLQEYVLRDPFKAPEMLRTREAFRFGLDVSLLGILVFLAPRRALYALFCIEFVVFVLGGVYYDYYGRLPRLTMVAGQAGEGAAIVPLVLGMIKPVRAACLLFVLALKALLVHRAATIEAAVPGGLKRWVGLGGATVYVALFAIANLTFDPLTNMKLWGTASRFGMTYGFAVPLGVEAYYAGSDSMLSRALDSAKKSTDRLSPKEADIPVYDRVVFLQVESLDYGLVGHTIDGVEVIPALNRLRETSMFYKAEAAHFTGSADADFVALMGVWPSRDIVTYKIREYPFGSALPHALAKYGYRTASIHGVSGAFFDRRDGFSKMGFDALFFREELHARSVPARHQSYEWIQDAEVMEFAAQELRRSPPKTFHLVITVSSHSPFQALPADEEAKCPRFSDLSDRYFCSMSYVDRAIGRYLEEVPEGTTLVIYGDHDSSISAPGYDSGRRGDRDWVPVFIYNHPGNLAAIQRARTTTAVDGSLTFVDVMKYVHAQIRRRHETGATGAQAAATLRHP